MNDPRIRRRLLFALTAVLCMWAGALVVVMVTQRGGAPSDAGSAVATVEDGYDGPLRNGPLPQGLDGRRAIDFALPDGWGGELDTRSLRGRPYLVTFLYTGCDDVCPLIARDIKAALDRLGPRADELAVVTVSTDPAGDTRGAVLEWLQDQGVPPNFHYVYGTPEELQPIWEAYYAVAQDPEADDSTHSASVWLVDGKGRMRTKFSAGKPVDPADLAHDLGVLLDERSGR